MRAFFSFRPLVGFACLAVVALFGGLNPALAQTNNTPPAFWLKGDLGFSRVTGALVSSDLGTDFRVDEDAYYGETPDGLVTRLDLGMTSVDRYGTIFGNAVVQFGRFDGNAFAADGGTTVPVQGRILSRVEGTYGGAQQTSNLYVVSGRGRGPDGHIYSFRVNLYEKNNNGWMKRSGDSFWGRSVVVISGVAQTRNEHLVSGFKPNSVSFQVSDVVPLNPELSKWMGDAVVHDDFGELQGGETDVSLTFARGDRFGTARVIVRVGRYKADVVGLHELTANDLSTIQDLEQSFMPTSLELEKPRSLAILRIPSSAYVR